MKHIRKRLLASVTALMLVCSMLPVSALAAEDETAELESPAAVEAAAVVPAEPAPAEPEAAPAEQCNNAIMKALHDVVDGKEGLKTTLCGKG